MTPTRLALLVLSVKASSLALADDPWRFTYGIDGPDVLFGSPGETVRGTYFVTMTHGGQGTPADVDCDGRVFHLERGSAYTWLVQLTAERAPGPNPFGISNGRIVSIGASGTDASACGFVGPGAQVQGQVLDTGEATDCEGLQSAWSQVALPYTNLDDDVRRHLPFNATSTIARVVVEFEMPRLEGIGAIDFVDGCRGPQFRNALRMTSDEIVYPQLEGKSIQLIAREEPAFRRGDSNTDGAVDISDGVLILAHLFQDGEAPRCEDAADANDDGSIDLSDAIRIMSFLFFGGEVPPEPGTRSCGEDPTRDSLVCATYEACGSRGTRGR